VHSCDYFWIITLNLFVATNIQLKVGNFLMAMAVRNGSGVKGFFKLKFCIGTFSASFVLQIDA